MNARVDTRNCSDTPTAGAKASSIVVALRSVLPALCALFWCLPCRKLISSPDSGGRVAPYQTAHQRLCANNPLKGAAA